MDDPKEELSIDVCLMEIVVNSHMTWAWNVGTINEDRRLVRHVCIGRRTAGTASLSWLGCINIL